MTACLWSTTSWSRNYNSACGEETPDFDEMWQFCPYCGKSLEFDYPYEPGEPDYDAHYLMEGK